MKKNLIVIFYLLAAVTGVKAQNLYGTTLSGGANGGGTINKFTLASNTLTTEHSFESIARNPVYTNFIQATNGKLYGMASGGKNNAGVIFSVDPATSTYTKLYDFNNTDGGDPNGSFVQAGDGKLYATTAGGGANNAGVIFSFDPTTSTYTKLADLDIANGKFPTGSLVQASD